MTGNPAYPDDFVGKLELFSMEEFDDGSSKETWLSDKAIITCLWSPNNKTDIPTSIHHQYV